MILDAMKAAGEPISASNAAELTGLYKKDVDKAFVTIKNDWRIVSPMRCKWEPAEK